MQAPLVPLTATSGRRRPATGDRWQRPFCLSKDQSCAGRPLSRRWRRCTATIEKPATSNSRPKPMSHRRSKPVNGSVLDFGVVLVFEAAGSLAGVVVFGSSDSFDGNVPVLGVVVGVVAGLVSDFPVVVVLGAVYVDFGSSEVVVVLGVV
jgi:hypothetical protein